MGFVDKIRKRELDSFPEECYLVMRTHCMYASREWAVLGSERYEPGEVKETGLIHENRKQEWGALQVGCLLQV